MFRLHNRIIFTAIALILSLSLVGKAQSDDEFVPSLWIEDYEELRAFISTHYANFDWAVESRDLNLIEMDAQVRADLAAARSADAAEAILEEFVAQFRDGHIQRLSNQPASTPSIDTDAPTDIPSATAAPEACSRLGASVGRFPRLRYTLSDPVALPEGVEFTPLPSDENAYSGGVLSIDGVEYGMVRIPVFASNGYMAACERTWEIRQGQTDEPCDEACRGRFLRLDVTEQLLDELAFQLHALESLGVKRLMIDVTFNGGGDDRAAAMASMIAGRDLTCPAIHVPRNDQWTELLARQVQALETARERAASPVVDSVLVEAIERLSVVSDQAADRCVAPEQVWEVDQPGHCERLTDAPYFACGAFAHRPNVDFEELGVTSTLYYPAIYSTPAVPKFDQLFVLINRGTASAAEIFPAMLKDNNEAILIGRPTYGIGCGYMAGGSRITLANSGMSFLFPNCQRLRADGTNEANKITPDIEVAWSRDHTPAEQLVLLVEALRAANLP